MKTTLALAASALLLAACASTGTAFNTAPRAVASSGTYYCWKGRLSDEGGNLVCNWEASAADACRSTGVASIARSSLARGPDNTRRCENGEWLVMVTTK